MGASASHDESPRCSEKASGSQGGAALVDPNGGASNSGSAQSSAASQPSRLSRARTARLRIEFATNRESQLLSWAVYLCTLLIDAAVVVMIVFKYNIDERQLLFQDKEWYVVNSCLAAGCLACLLALLAWFGANLHSTRLARRSWSYRRMSLSRTAGVLLTVQIISTVFWLAPYAQAAVQRCSWFDDGIAWMAFVRWTSQNCIFYSTVAMAHECCRYRGPAPPADPDEQLVMDVTLRQKLHIHAPKLVLWLLFEGITVARTITRVRRHAVQVDEQAQCDEAQYDCDEGTAIQVLTAVQLLVTVLYALGYAFYLWRAFRDHAYLPYARYRLSNIHIRLMARHGTAAFLTVIVSSVVLSAVRFQSCWSYLDSSLGMAPVQLSLALLVAVQAVALMPKAGQTRDLLTTCMQRFSWTLEGLPRAIAAREAERRQAAEAEGPALLRLLSGGRRLLLRLSPAPPSPAAEKGQEQHPQQSQPQQHQSFSLEGSNAERLEQRRCEREQEQLSALQRSDAGGLQQPAAQPAHPGPSRGVSAPLAAAPAPHDSRSTLGSRSVLRALSRRASALLHPHHHEHRQGHDVPPMFCFELAVRLFYWTKLAYRYWLGPAGQMDPVFARRLFGFSHLESFRDPATDTRALLAWRHGSVLLAFRGTASSANIATDLKAWQTPVLPRRHHAGRLVKAHAGFYHAYAAMEARHSLLARIQELAAGFGAAEEVPGGLRLYLTGHSLGGALAMLAAADLARLLPHAAITLYTFGSPRVGNAAFAAEYRGLVPDSWGVVNDQDPVPRIPGYGFRHCCNPVVVNARGDIIVKPSYFERSVLSRKGGTVTHHQLLRYALSLAAVLKAQFSANKWLPGGGAGAAALASSMDLGAVLLLRNVDLAALRDPLRPPLSSELPKAKKKLTGQPGAAQPPSCGAGLLQMCSGSCQDSGGSSGLEQDVEAVWQQHQQQHQPQGEDFVASPQELDAAGPLAGSKDAAAAAIQADELEAQPGAAELAGAAAVEQAGSCPEPVPPRASLAGEGAEFAADAADAVRGTVAAAVDAAAGVAAEAADMLEGAVGAATPHAVPRPHRWGLLSRWRRERARQDAAAMGSGEDGAGALPDERDVEASGA